MTDDALSLLFHLYDDTPRQGPGDPALLERMLAALTLPDAPRVAELGCGTGASALHLAELLGADVVGIDFAKPFIAAFERRLAAAPPRRGHVTPRLGDIATPELELGALDLLVSEGAAYSIGFGAAMKRWRPLVKPGGALVVSECVWFGVERPDEAAAFWAEGYPEMGTVADAIGLAEAADWRLVAAERLPSAAWWTHYYNPLTVRMSDLALEAGQDPALAALIADIRSEMLVMKHFGDACGYVYLAFDTLT